MKNIISLLFVSVAILGFIIYFIISKMAQSDTILKSFQLPQKVLSSKPAFPLQERAFLSHRELKDYEIIAENNLFRPLGWKGEVQSSEEPAPTVAPEPTVQIPPPPTYTLVLTGIAKTGSDWIAIVEDQKQDEGVFLRRGEMLKDVRVADIMLEHITLVRDEMPLQLALGESIEYGIDGRVRFDTVGTENLPGPTDKTDTSSPTEADSDGGDGEKRLLERMRERRRRELDQ